MAEGMPTVETDELGRYLEDTITIDWQTPIVTATAKRLLESLTDPEERVRRLFEFVRDEIEPSEEFETEAQTCRASEVLEQATGLCYAKSHLLAGLFRYAGIPAGFCYVRMAKADQPDKFELHAFNAVYWAPKSIWIFMDAWGSHADSQTECRFEEPWSLSCWPEVDKGESFLPLIYKRPAKRIIDLLERAPSLEAIRKNLPDAI
ncbi:MAG: transglutaminase-like domain-containing protein [Myxococcota bacterium]